MNKADKHFLPFKMFILSQNQSIPSNGYHSNRQEDILQVFYQRLSYFLMTGEYNNKEIMEEIERQISDLKQKVKQLNNYDNFIYYNS